MSSDGLSDLKGVLYIFRHSIAIIFIFNIIYVFFLSLTREIGNFHSIYCSPRVEPFSFACSVQNGPFLSLELTITSLISALKLCVEIAEITTMR